VPGLFAAGKCRGGIGISLMTGWSWCSCVASGFLAGQAAGDYAGEVGYGRTGKKQVEALSKSIFEPMTRMGFETSDAVLKEIQETVFPYDIMILKHEKRLRKALDRIRRIYDEQAPEMTASDVHELVRVKETESILLNAEMFLLSSIKRTESRHGHFREDFPERDDANWLKMVALSRNSEGAIDINTVTL
jgi:succinate dehydrogenase/fumarate reductase flavoprotein subunit